MTPTTIVAESFLETALKKYNITDAEIAKLSDKCLALKVASVIDKEGYAIVKQAHTEIRKKRIGVEDKRKELKKESLDFGKAVDVEAKRITALLTPAEEHLLEQKKIVDDEELRIANEKARLAQEVIDKAEAIKKKEEEDKQAAIKLAQEAESKRLDKIRIEQEMKERKLQEAQDKVDAQRRVFADQVEREARQKQQQEDIEQAKKTAKIDAEEKVMRDAETKRIAEEQATKDEVLRVSLLPDNEKLKVLASKIDNLEMPSLTHKESCVVLDDAKIYLDKACEMLRRQQ